VIFALYHLYGQIEGEIRGEIAAEQLQARFMVNSTMHCLAGNKRKAGYLRSNPIYYAKNP
jgi:hypothetical protein